MPKSYSKFKLKDLKALGITLKKKAFGLGQTPLAPSDLLVSTLKNPPSLQLNTEKAKSEFLIAPILRELVILNAHSLSAFSGEEFDVDAAQGLTGVCDYIFSKDSQAVSLEAPVFFVVEAKNENLNTGVPQCAAELFAAKRFNEAAGKKNQTVFGVVTFGREWLFLKIEGDIVWQDSEIFYLNDLPRLLGALQEVVSAT